MVLYSIKGLYKPLIALMTFHMIRIIPCIGLSVVVQLIWLSPSLGEINLVKPKVDWLFHEASHGGLLRHHYPIMAAHCKFPC